MHKIELFSKKLKFSNKTGMDLTKSALVVAKTHLPQLTVLRLVADGTTATGERRDKYGRGSIVRTML
ncbi:MAG: hypothetical protein JWR50_995 [Mucilaginibacter sp.]|nr:hypothetical protein [Mucilaginibacter sp.]